MWHRSITVVLTVEATALALCAIAAATLPHTYDPDGFTIMPSLINEANQANAAIAGKVLGASGAAAFVFLRTAMLLLTVLFALINVSLTIEFLNLIESRKIVRKIYLAIPIVFVFVISAFTVLFLTHDALGIDSGAQLIGDAQGGLWWIAYPWVSWLVAASIPILLASSLLLFADLLKVE